MGFGSFLKRAGMAAATGGMSEVYYGTKDVMNALSPNIDMSSNITGEAGETFEDLEAERKRKLKAAEELNPTGSLGTGSPTVKRSNILGTQ